jgi:radical SAM protein with 4Fe4S-binding SPASM domain
MAEVIPNQIILQWHITDRCNYRCSHCYQERFTGNDLALPEIWLILDAYRALLEESGKRAGRKIRGHITVTGGEPFIRADFDCLLEGLSKEHSWTTFGILTNGSLIDEAVARRLKVLKTSFVQISLDGGQAVHDRIRGAGSHEHAIQALKHLVRAGVRTLLSFTAYQGNYREFPEVVRLGRRLKVWRVWADRMIPQGAGTLLADQYLSPDATREFFELMQRSRAGGLQNFFSRTEVNMQRALQFLVGGGKPYSCQAGGGLITIMPDGSLYPCRRLPVRVGNVLDTPLQDLYFHGTLFRSLRDRNRVSQGCEDCFYARLCRGGLRCLSSSLRGDPFTADPGCWRATPTRPPDRGASEGGVPA